MHTREKKRAPRNHARKRSASAAAPALFPARVAATTAAYLVTADRGCKDELATLRREHKELHDAMFEATRVQRKLCAPREMRRNGFEIAGEMFAVRQLSGDFLKILDLGSAVGLAVGDIAGKGISAALWLAHVVGLIRVFAAQHPDLAHAAGAINRELCALVAEPPLAALFLARLDTLTGELIYVNAGQPSALLICHGGAVEELNHGGPMLGAVPHAEFVCGRVILQHGDTLLACTDGAFECRNPREEEFGAQRLAAAVAAAGSVAASQILFSTLAAALDFAGPRKLDDDLTLLVVHHRVASLPA